MTSRCLVICVSTAFCVLFLGPTVASSEVSLAGRIASLVANARYKEANVAVAVVDGRGHLVVGIIDRLPFKPASNQKLLTTAAALHFLGLDYSYHTRVWACAPLVGGTIGGDILVRGAGDPNISGRFHEDQPDYLLRLWASRLHEAGLRRIEGAVIADDRFFDDERFLPSWKRAQEASWYSAQISALTLNDNCLDITVRPAPVAGRPARVEIQPPCSLLKIEGTPRTVATGKTLILVHRKTGTNQITIKGTIRQGREFWKGNVTVDDPALFFAAAFTDALRRNGITVLEKPGKKARVGVRDSAGELVRRIEDEGCDERVLVQHTSTLAEDLPVVQKHSQNLHAELLLKTIGAQVFGDGSRAGGERAVRKFLSEKKIAHEKLVLGDGSGLSHENRLTARLLARLLHSVRAETYFDAFRGALPVAGVDGTLKRRFRAPSVARGKVVAKTGFILGVSALSGYVTRGDRLWSFSILINGFPPGARSAKVLQQRICEELYRALEPAPTGLAK